VSITVDLQQAAAALDLEERLRATPTAARVRGIWFKMTEDAVKGRGPAAEAAFREAGGGASRWVFRLYDARHYLAEAALAAALIDPMDPREGLRAMWRRAAGYSGFLHPGSFLHLLGPDPMQALRWLIRYRDHFATFGVWRLEERSPEHAVVHVDEELIWIDSAHKGGAEGLLDASGVSGAVEVELLDRFSGRLHLRWERRAARDEPRRAAP
jgi:uncharacterized protein (TIGR02265 family)